MFFLKNQLYLECKEKAADHHGYSRTENTALAGTSTGYEISGAVQSAPVSQAVLPQLRGNERLETGISEADRRSRGNQMEELLKKLNDAGVRYVVIGGQAMLQEGMPRFTLDWDLFIPPFDQANFDKLNAALADELDMSVEPLDVQTGDGFVQTFQTSGGILQFHLSPPGLPKFSTVEARAVVHEFHGVPVKYLCLDDLLSSKLAVERDKDSDDILFLTIKKQSQQNG